jgi:hypothetical protein
MAYQQDTLADVLRRGFERSEALSADNVVYLTTQVERALASLDDYDGGVPQTLSHNSSGVMRWVTGLDGAVDTTATPNLTLVGGIITAAEA